MGTTLPYIFLMLESLPMHFCTSSGAWRCDI